MLPVLALDLQPGDVVLDMCAAPGGKTLTILQTLMPHIMVANDVQKSRVDKIYKVIDQYLAGIGQWDERLFVTKRDARCIDDKDMFNKVIHKKFMTLSRNFYINYSMQILVDVQCTTDRHVLHSEKNNIFKPQRIQERLKMPELQAEILTYEIRHYRKSISLIFSIR